MTTTMSSRRRPANKKPPRKTQKTLNAPAKRGRSKLGSKPAVSGKQQRRSQTERSAETRERLLDAAFGLLHEAGYGGATTTAIAERAGVSLGGMQHQFPTKALLMGAVLRRVVALRIKSYRQALRGVEPGFERFKALTEASWRQIGAKELTASMEIELAMRREPELQALVEPILARHSAFMQRLVTGMLSEHFRSEKKRPDEKRLDAVRILNNAVMIGLSMELVRASDEAAVERALACWRTVLMDDLALDFIPARSYKLG